MRNPMRNPKSWKHLKTRDFESRLSVPCITKCQPVLTRIFTPVSPPLLLHLPVLLVYSLQHTRMPLA